MHPAGRNQSAISSGAFQTRTIIYIDTEVAQLHLYNADAKDLYVKSEQ